MPDTGQFAIGIDTGGTYTDALVYCRATERVVAKAKVPTTHSDLGGCVSEALRGTLFNGPVRLPEVGLVSVSTTLATNALVEGGGRPAGLITIGLEDAITKRRGLGDLILTCTDDQSRNRRVGLAIGQGQDISQALKTIGQEAEGINTARELYRQSKALGVEMPISEQVYRIVFEGLNPKQAVTALLSREARAEG